MSPVENADRTSLLEKIAFIRGQKDKIKNLPNQVDSFCGDLAKAIRGYSYGSVLIPTGVGVVNAFNAEHWVDMLYDERDKLNRALGDSWTELNKIDPDLEVPVKFIDVANEWRNLKTAVQQAESDFDRTKLSGEWHGDAATRYGIIRTGQATPLHELQLVFEDIAVSLEAVAKAELELYSHLATKVQELEAAVVEFVGDFSGAVFTLPMGPVTAAADVANIAEAAKTFVVETITAMAESDATNIIESQKIAQNGGYQRGIPDNKWPAAVNSAPYGSGLDGVKEAIGDATTSDGDKSDWDLGPAATVAQ